jgi:rod shape-determining protein MreC
VPVGTVISVQPRAGSLTQTAVVQPFVNFTALGVVGVVVQVPRHNPRTSILPRPAPTVTVTVTPSATRSSPGTVSPSISTSTGGFSSATPSAPATGGG